MLFFGAFFFGFFEETKAVVFPVLPKRKKIRLSGYDYSSNGLYFVTICTKDREPLLCSGGRIQFAPTGSERPVLTAVGKAVEQEISRLSTVYPGVWVERYSIMPDHVHILRVISKDSAEEERPQLSRIIKLFKSSVTKRLGFSVWQKSFYDEIIKSPQHLERVWNYVEYNHLKLHKNMP